LGEAFSTPTGRLSVFHAIFVQQCIHVVADPVAKVVADAAHGI
jgi:hypothetical protein